MAAVKEFMGLGPDLAAPLLEYGLSVYHLHLDILLQLRPDVVLTCLQTAHGAVLEGELLEAALLSALGYAPRVVHCGAESLEGVWEDMAAVAAGLGAADAGAALVAAQRERMAGAAAAARGRGSLNVAVIQWPHPLMAAGSWVPEMVGMAGSADVLAGPAAAAAAGSVSEAQLASSRPDVLVFALCGLSLERSLKAAAAAVRRLAAVWPDLPAARSGRVAVVDGERVFSRPGPALAQSMEALVEVLHPEAQRYGHQGTLWQWLPSPT